MVDQTMGNTLAYDGSAINRLKYSGHKQDPASIKAASKQFEALFLKQMLSGMRKAMPKSHLLGDSNARDQYQDMMDTQWSQKLADGGGIGLAKMLTKQLTHQSAHHNSSATADVSVSGHSIPRAQPRMLAPSDSLASIKAQRAAAAATATHTAAQKKKVVDSSDQAAPLVATAATSSAPLLSFTRSDIGDAVSRPVREFVDRLREPAQRAADTTGLSSRLILAQAALETGWGRHEITTDSGKQSFNVFNIKATGWKGDSTAVATHEYDHGVRQATTDGFRVYDSYDQAFDDYARLIESSPRYAKARGAADPQAAAQALQDGGYATDPKYADKLVAVMHAIPQAAAAGGLFAKGREGALIDVSGSGGQPLV